MRATPTVRRALLKRLRGALGLVTTMLLLAACASSKPAEPPARPGPAVVRKPAPPREAALYTADEALRDVLSSELEHVGTGRWPGVERSRACAFRNQRVLVVNAYCTLHETNAFRLDVYSPERGRVRIYAEALGAVSARRRAEYFSFLVESSPPPGPNARLPPVALTMSYDDLSRYEQARYDAFLPGCFGGEQHHRRVGGCLDALAPREPEWSAQHRAFLERASDDWYRVVHHLRALAARYGAHPSERSL